MALPTTGPISLRQIQTEFGGSNPASLSEYYYNGTHVKTTNNGKIPSSGINKFSNYRGAVKGILVDYLVVGGGGGAGTHVDSTAFGDGGGGGGGAGGFVSGSILLNTTTVIVGAGGAGGLITNASVIKPGNYIQGSVTGGKVGSDSKLGNIVAEGGGGGGSCSYNWYYSIRGLSSKYSTAAGTAGTSGGSGGGGTLTGQAGGAGTSGQGFAGGGAGRGGQCSSGSGGGGAGGAGETWRVTQGTFFGDTAKGGIGKKWLDGVFYAAGGHSSHGQMKDGGTQCDRRPPAGNAGGGGSLSNGGVNTGGGAGSGTPNPCYSGGSGIVIIRYPGTVAEATGGTITYSGGYVYHTFRSSGTFGV